MKQRIKVLLSDGWADISHENPSGPATFCRDADDASGALQVSHAEYKAGVVPNPSLEDLVSLATSAATNERGAALLHTASGHCRFGLWGTAVHRTDECAHFQAWHLSNGRDFIFATYISEVPPSEVELIQAHNIVMDLTLERRPWWRRFLS